MEGVVEDERFLVPGMNIIFAPEVGHELWRFRIELYYYCILRSIILCWHTSLRLVRHDAHARAAVAQHARGVRITVET